MANRDYNMSKWRLNAQQPLAPFDAFDADDGSPELRACDDRPVGGETPLVGVSMREVTDPRHRRPVAYLKASWKSETAVRTWSGRTSGREV